MDDASTGIRNGGGTSFPLTHWSLLQSAADGDQGKFQASLEELAQLYWRPIYTYVRRRWTKTSEEAKDLTQDFFLALLEKDILNRLSPERGRFRAYVMGALDNFVRMDYRRRAAQHRGGGAIRLSMEVVEETEPAAGEPPEKQFAREWADAVLQDALEEMDREYRARGLAKAFELFRTADLDGPDDADVGYPALARRFQVSVTDVTNWLHRARRRLRELVERRVQQTVSDPVEAQGELRDLFGTFAREA
ncbi:MAG: sigma-70 family RNA polymerase sigma factor [Planctomycetes bacterium]|nr:sigma-70 family RNA polymerase sigma factor [Planctomycetota bacterium]